MRFEMKVGVKLSLNSLVFFQPIRSYAKCFEIVNHIIYCFLLKPHFFRNKFENDITYLDETFSGIKEDFSTEIEKLQERSVKAENQVNLTDQNIRSLNEGKK